LRHANVVSKLTTDSPVTYGIVESERYLVPLLENSSRWNFWPWRLDKYVGRSAVRAAKLVWTLLLISSVAAWIVVFRRARRVADDG
jgi:hypothetical protein